MRAFLFGFSPRPGSHRSLAARGQLFTNFAGLGFAVAFSLLALGGYLIEEQFRDPVQAGATGLLSAALFIATAVTLLYCLLHRSRKRAHRGAAWPGPVPWESRIVVVARGNKGPRTENGNHSSLHGRYVDPARVQIRR